MLFFIFSLFLFSIETKTIFNLNDIEGNALKNETILVINCRLFLILFIFTLAIN